MKTVVVVGGGVIGCAVAYYAARRGLDVTLVDTPKRGRATSASAGGLWPIGESVGLGCGVIFAKAMTAVRPDRDGHPNYSRMGTLFIPNTVAMIKGCPNPDGAKKLIDFLLSPEIETKLAQSASRQIPLNPQVKLDAIKHLQTPRSVRALPVDFAKAAELWHESQEFLVKEFGLR